MARIVFLTCHLTGTGHLVRTLVLARAALAEGHAVTVISGGRPLDHLDTSGLDLVQLPPLTVHGFEFSVLRQPDGAPASPDYMATRSDLLGKTLQDRRPDALITELFPFGRRVLAPEFDHAISVARTVHPSCAIISSIRDVPEPKPRRIAEVAKRVTDLLDAVIVHGDRSVIPLEATWPLPDAARSRVRYAGYLGAHRPMPGEPRGDTVLVAVGGGVLGRDLLRVAVDGAAHTSRPWHILVGGADAPDFVTSLRAQSRSADLLIEPARPDYRVLLAKAAVSVSLCGYNTALDLAQETVPALLVPSEEAGEQEQLIRARHWAQYDRIELVRLQDLTPYDLAATTTRLAEARSRAPLPIEIDRGTKAVALIREVIACKSNG
ncbi:MAG: glycosyltransferase [Pseudomonadota bacterium]